MLRQKIFDFANSTSSFSAISVSSLAIEYGKFFKPRLLWHQYVNTLNAFEVHVQDLQRILHRMHPGHLVDCILEGLAI